MFHSAKKSGQDKNKNINKFLDPKRDTHGRMKALKVVLDLHDSNTAAVFFNEYYGPIFYLLYEEFTNLELSSKSKGSRIKDELEELLTLFEKVFIYLPDKIHARWQFNSISLILRKLLHHGNILSIREQGLRLFMLWLHIMQERIDEFNLAIYGSLVPGFPSPIDKISLALTHRDRKCVEYNIACVNGATTVQSYFQSEIDNEDEWCITEGCNALCPPQQGDKVPLPEELTKKFLVRVSHFMTRRILLLHWNDKHMRGSGFHHVFNHFKRFYLPLVFPLWDPKDYLYSATEMISVPINPEQNPQQQQQHSENPPQLDSVLRFCQCAIFSWLVKFTVTRLRRPEVRSSTTFDSTSTLDESSANGNTGSNTESTTTNESSPAVSKDYEMFCDSAKIVRAILYSTQENVTVVHEIFRQGFLMPLSCVDIMDHILQVYREWLFKLKDRPLFMLEEQKDAETLKQLVQESVLCDSPLLRSSSYKVALAESENFFFNILPVQNVKAGFQSNLRLFIAISAQIFFVKQQNELLTKHVDICRKVMKVYRTVVLEMRLDSCTWQQLLTVLLKIANHILTKRPPPQRCSTLGGQLAGYLLQTLFVTWVRGSMQVHIKTELWDELLKIGITFNCWEEFIKEWAGTMVTLTRVMARTVYGIDVQDPPLEKLTVRGKVKKFKKKITTSQTPDPDLLFKEEQTYQPHKTSMSSNTAQMLPRSASEPGIGSGNRLLKKFSQNISESAIQEFTSRDIVEEDQDSSQLANKQMHLKKTLAEIAYSKSDSLDSDTNSVFTQSLNTTMNLQEAIQKQKQKYIVPQLNVESDSEKENESEGDNQISSYIMYEPLKDAGGNLSTSIPYSSSLHSINSGSSENLIDNDKESKDTYFDADDLPSTSSTNAISGSSEDDILSKTSNTLSPHDSSTSDQDLITFDADGVDVLSKPTALDTQSIDSHRFFMIDSDNYNELKLCEDIKEILVDDIEGSEEDEKTVTFAQDVTDQDDDSPKEEAVSVIEGGKLEGWIPLSSVVLWQRFLGILGNVNKIIDPEIHASVFSHLIDIWKMLEIIKKNQGISIDNKVTPPPPPLTPPLYFCASWCVQAVSQVNDVSYKAGRVLAYKLLCMMIMKSDGLKPPDNLMIHFYRLLRIGLTTVDQEIINAIIGECSLIISVEFEGIACLMLDFIQAANTVLSTQYLLYPRKEAVSILGSMICMPGAYPELKIYQTNITGIGTHVVLTGKELREKVLLPILKAAKNDPSCRARCIALNCLGLFIAESLMTIGGHQRIYECLSLLLSSLEFHSRTVSSVALDVLWSLIFYYKELSAFDKHLPLKLIEAMCHIALHLRSLIPVHGSVPPAEDCSEYICKLLLCLLDWVMVVPKDLLLNNVSERESDRTYLSLTMKVFKEFCVEKVKNTTYERRISLNVNQIFSGDSRPVRLARVHNDLDKDDGLTEDEDDTDFLDADSISKENILLESTSQYAISHILNYYEHFPFNTGSVQPDSTVSESEDLNFDGHEDADLLESENMQFLLINGTTLLSVVEICQQDNFKSATKLDGLKTVSRFVLRDAIGKYCWDISDLFPIQNAMQEEEKKQKELMCRKRTSLERKHSRNLSMTMARLTSVCPSDILPTWKSVDKNTDRTDQLLRYIGHSSPECLIYPDQQLNTPSPVPSTIDSTIQASIVTSVLKQHNEEENYVHEISQTSNIIATEVSSPLYNDPSSPFHISKLLLHQLGYFSWKNRDNIELLERNERLAREIKNLDNRPCRETQKIAVFYIGPGQEDKHSILSNTEGSVKFEKFLAGMSWEVDLATHTGFMGGLERNLSTGATAPYFSTHSLEIMFHVSTRMPGAGEEQLKTKFRHLGNDEIHIIWSEHNRDFRRGIINTEFADVLIIIYPLKQNFFRIQIDKNNKIPPFGPLFDGAIIDGDLLPLLVRSTAVNAGRAKRSTLPMYNRHFEERARCIHEISQSRVHKSSFEDFCSRLFAPTFSDLMSKRLDSLDGMHRTSSLPLRTNTMTNPATVLKMLDLSDHHAFRSRTSSALPMRKPTNKKDLYRTSSNSSLNNVYEDGTASGGLFSDTDVTKDFVQRRKSLTKKLKKKASSIDVITNEKE